MGWRTDHYPPSALGLHRRAPDLAARLVGWFPDDPMLLVTLDVRERFWLWRWEKSDFVNLDGERLRGGMGDFGPAQLWVPHYGPWERVRRANAGDHMAGIIDLLRRAEA